MTNIPTSIPPLMKIRADRERIVAKEPMGCVSGPEEEINGPTSSSHSSEGSSHEGDSSHKVRMGSSHRLGKLVMDEDGTLNGLAALALNSSPDTLPLQPDPANVRIVAWNINHRISDSESDDVMRFGVYTAGFAM
jgi:hypothetical protein